MQFFRRRRLEGGSNPIPGLRSWELHTEVTEALREALASAPPETLAYRPDESERFAEDILATQSFSASISDKTGAPYAAIEKLSERLREAELVVTTLRSALYWSLVNLSMLMAFGGGAAAAAAAILVWAIVHRGVVGLPLTISGIVVTAMAAVSLLGRRPLVRQRSTARAKLPGAVVGAERLRQELDTLWVEFRGVAAVAVRDYVSKFLAVRSAPSYSMEVPTPSTWTLADLGNPVYELCTPAMARLIGMIERLPGAAIGLAGQRGAGKSTLLRALRQLRPRDAGGRAPYICISATVPVKYEIREFLLFLFGRTCERVRATITAEARPSRRVTRRWRLPETRAAGPASNLCSMVYGFLGLSGLLVTHLLQFADPLTRECRSGRESVWRNALACCQDLDDNS